MENVNNAPEMETTPVLTSEQHVEQNTEVTSPAPEQNEENKRELNKMSQLERERNELRRQAEENEARYKALSSDLNRTFKGSPEAYEAFRREYNRLTPDSPLASYEEAFGQRPQPTTVSSAQKQLSPDEIAELAAQKMREKQDQQTAKEAFNQFIGKRTQFKPETATQQDRELLVKITAMADVFVQNYNMSPAQALEEAYMSVPENRGKITEEAREDGELLGKARAFAKGAGESAPASSGTSNIPKSGLRSKLNPSQQKRYDELFVKNPKIAERYVQNILEP